MSKKPILCVDFDGVVHAYTSPWTNAETISDGPVPGALRWLYAATEFFDVQIYSSRSKSEAARIAMLRWFACHSAEEFGYDHPMACGDYKSNQFVYPLTFAAEKPAALNWAEINPLELLTFKPWNKR